MSHTDPFRDGPFGGSSGTIARGMTLLGFGSWVKIDPNAREAAVPAQQASGWRFSVTGSWTSADPMQGLTYYDPVPCTDVRGLPFGSLSQLQYVADLIERSGFGTSSDTLISFWLGSTTNAATPPSAGGASFNGVGFGIQYATASRAGRKFTIAAGVGTLIAAGTANANIRHAPNVIGRNGEGAASVLFADAQPGYQLLDSARAGLGVGFGTGAASQTTGNLPVLWRGINILRTAATAGTATGDYDLAVAPGLAFELVA